MYSRASVQYSDFLDRAQLLKQGYVAPRVIFDDRHRDLVDSYEISISQMAMYHFSFDVDVVFHLSPTRPLPDLII